MELTEPLSFDHDDRKAIYDYVERHGAVTGSEIRRALDLDRTAFGHHVTVLRRDGYLRKVDGHYEVAFTMEDAEDHAAPEVEYTIRSAGQMDLTGLIGVMRQVAGEGTYIEAETVADLIDYEEVVLRHNELHARMVFVATVEEEVVGWVHLDLPEADKLAHTAVLTVGVLPEYRCKGVGSALLDRGVAWASDRGFEKLYNSVPATNEDAHGFLESHGWETEAVRADHYKIDDEYVDELLMAVDLQ
jgi:ribosomal protein S18 acetylase RimI-like enzyme